jgi:hypothetical protein
MHTPMVVKHVIVDGSNIATEGREAPSLAQLDEAVRAFVAEYGPDIVTVVVDATFPNRIDSSERQTYEDAVVANELITPPAGAIGRGDGFVLQIADKAGATILSNDSFQEFHGRYPWLFERGRLIGGKPVPHVGWVFMERAPVRGPTSRRAVSEARKEAKAAASSGGAAVAKPAARKTTARKSRAKAAEPAAPVVAEPPAVPEAPALGETPSGDGASAGAGPGAGSGDGAGSAGESYNEALAFIEFVGAHPVGSEVEATVERFSSHGAYAAVGEARAYLPLRYLADPPPRSAKEVLTVGETRSFVVVAIDPPRRGIDLGLPGVVEAPSPPPPAESPAKAPPRKRASRKKSAEPVPAEPEAATETATEPARSTRKRTSRKKAAEPVPAAAPEESAPPAKPAAPARKRASRKKAAEATAPEQVADTPEPQAAEPAPPAARKRASRKKAAEPQAAEATGGPEPAAPTRKRASRKRAAEPRSPEPAEAAPPATAAPSSEGPGPEPQASAAPARKRASRKKAAEPAPAEPAAAMNDGPEPAKAAPARKRASRKKAAESNSPAQPANPAENGQGA